MRYLPNGREIRDLWTKGVPFLFQVKVYEWDTYNDNMIYKRERGWTLPLQNFAKYPLGNVNAGQSYFIVFGFQQTSNKQRHWHWGDPLFEWWTLANETAGKMIKNIERAKSIKHWNALDKCWMLFWKNNFRPLQSWRARNSKGKRDRTELSKMLSCTLVIIIIQKTFCNCQNFVVM